MFSLDAPNAAAPNADDGLLALAFYFVIDVSYSMEISGAIVEAQQIVPDVVDAIAASNSLADVARVGLIDFSDDAQVVLRLDDVRNIQHIPQLQARGGTSYAAAFRLLRKEIEADRTQLKQDGYRAYRPAVFFITDGAPTDDESITRAAFNELTDPSFRARPNIMPCGIDQATKQELDKWVHGKNMRSFVARTDKNIGTALQELAGALIGSVVASTQSVSDQGTAGGFVPPDDDELDDWD